MKKAILGDMVFIAPSLLLYELNSVFVTTNISSADYEIHMSLLSAYIQNEIIHIIEPDQALLKEAKKLADLDKKGQGYISCYDATFHALAFREKAVFLTADKKHIQKTEKRIGMVLDFDDLDIE